VPQLSILVVDDDHDVRDHLRDILTSEGYGVAVLDDPTGVVEELERGDYHILVLDLMMPRLSGIDVLTRIREVDDDVAVVILTGSPRLETAASAIEHDVSAYIRKPFAVKDFREAIRRIAYKKGLPMRPEDEILASIRQAVRELRKSRGLTLKQMGRRKLPTRSN
jgi:two-component system, OmpR family, response regulator